MKRFNISILLLNFIIIFLSSCKEEKFNIDTEGRLDVFMTGLGIEYENLATSLNKQRLSLLLGQRNTFEIARQKFNEFIFTENTRQTISYWYERRMQISDEKLKSQVESMTRILLLNSIEYDKELMNLSGKILTELSALKYNTGDKLVPLSEIIRLMANSSHEKAIELYAEISRKQAPFKQSVHQLLKERNKLAGRKGYENYTDIIFSIEKFDNEQLDALLIGLEETTREVYRTFLILESGSQELYPDYRDLDRLFSKSAKSNPVDMKEIQRRCESLLTRLGLSIDKKLEYYNKPAAGPARFTISHLGKYSFLLPASGGSYNQIYDFLFEYGIGIYYTHLIDVPRILTGHRGISGSGSRIYSSSMGELFRILAIKSNDIREVLGTFSKNNSVVGQNRIETIYRLRKKLMMIDFEWSLYTDPSLDPDKLYRNLIEKYLFASLPEEAGTDWAGNINFVSDPFENATDLLGSALGFQLYDALVKKIGEENFYTHTCGAWISRYLFSYGEMINYSQRLKDITGKDLDINYMLDYYKTKD